jgi:hypothetical protein
MNSYTASTIIAVAILTFLGALAYISSRENEEIAKEAIRAGLIQKSDWTGTHWAKP